MVEESLPLSHSGFPRNDFLGARVYVTQSICRRPGVKHLQDGGLQGPRKIRVWPVAVNPKGYLHTGWKIHFLKWWVSESTVRFLTWVLGSLWRATTLFP